MEYNNQKQNYTLGNFIPLIIIFCCIIILTVIAQWWRGLSVYGAMTDFMGFFFLIFGSFKLFNWAGFIEAYSIYDVIAKRSRLYATFYPLIEISLGIAYIMRWHLSVINPVVFGLMIINALGVVQELQANKAIICACLGTVFKIPMTWITLMEDILMAAMSLWMIIWQL